VDQMVKKPTAIILIVAFAATGLITEFGGQNIAQAANTWEAHIGYSGPDTYNFCYHTHWGYTDNMGVGLGIDARYNTAHGGTPPYEYYKTRWMHFSCLGYGGSRSRYFYPYDYNSMQICDCWWKINDVWHEYNYDANVNPSWKDGLFSMTAYYPSSTGFYYLNPYGTTICGRISQYFYEDHYPYPIVYYLSVQAQPWDRVTACAGPNSNYTGYITEVIQYP
jgi:hypothetical protein